MEAATDTYLCPVSMPLRADQRAELKRLSTETGKPMAVHIREAIDAYLSANRVALAGK
jgi:predicted DNA-binding protein